jgi:hypothetical protein
MQNRELTKQLQALNNLIKRTSEACGDNLELQAEWARYLCVLSAGFLENAIKEIYLDFASRRVSEPLANYVSSTLSPIRSPKSVKFLEIAGAFNSDWRDELENYGTVEGGIEAIDSIMVNRHLIAHGKSRDSRMSLAALKEYLGKSANFLEFIEEQTKR